MIKEIKYNGFTETPSDYESPDGDLASALNLVNEDEALRPVASPTTLFTLPSDYRVVFIHRNSGYKHYIVQCQKKLYWIDEPAQGTALTVGNFTSNNLLKDFSYLDIYDFNSVGNTFIMLASDGIHYILWKSNVEGYKYLGTHIPEMPLTFGLQGEMVRTDEFTINFDNIDFFDGDILKEFTDENKTKITEQVLAKVNKFIAEKTTNAGKFMYPFFVRYTVFTTSRSLCTLPLFLWYVRLILRHNVL